MRATVAREAYSPASMLAEGWTLAYACLSVASPAKSQERAVALRLKPTYETEIYTTQGGYVAIKQDDRLGEESTVILTAAQLPDVIRELQALHDDRESWQYGDADESDEHDARPPAS